MKINILTDIISYVFFLQLCILQMETLEYCCDLFVVCCTVHSRTMGKIAMSRLRTGHIHRTKRSRAPTTPDHLRSAKYMSVHLYKDQWRHCRNTN